MIAALDAAGIRYGQVSASHPTLDDVYLHFVGHTFDGAQGADDILEGQAA